MDREPLTVRGLAAMVVAAVVELLVVLGVPLPPGLEAAIVGVVAVGALVYLVVTGRRQVTALADPRDGDGVRLARVDGKPVKR